MELVITIKKLTVQIQYLTKRPNEKRWVAEAKLTPKFQIAKRHKKSLVKSRYNAPLDTELEER